MSKKVHKEPLASEATPRLDGPDRIYEFADSVNEKIHDAEEAAEEKRAKQKWLLFGLEAEYFTIPVAKIQEILRIQRITPVPHAPYTVRGITNMRGHVVPVVDLRVRLGLRPGELTPSSRVLITVSKERTLGLLVDVVERILNLDPDAVEPPPPDILTEQSEYILGIYRMDDRLAVLLDVERVLLISETLEQTNRRRISEQEEMEPVST